MLLKSNTHTHCPWKGEASYYTIKADKTELKDAAWYYPETKEKANNIKGYVAFCKCPQIPDIRETTNDCLDKTMVDVTKE